MIKLSIQQGDIIKFNCFYAFNNNRIPKYIKQKPTEEENRSVHNYTWRLQCSFLRTERKIRKKSMKSWEKHNTTSQHDLTCRVHYTKNNRCLFFSGEDGPFPRHTTSQAIKQTNVRKIKCYQVCCPTTTAFN